ncbi:MULTISPECIES: phage major capsid protein [Clostridium]|uniref:Phage major capsid protein n=1 Tax=Clostridium lapidicellarium TaxID=3240931 RepID=A0ABV4DWH0_9CLOT
MSKELRALFDKLRTAQDKAQTLMNKDDVTAEELNKSTQEIDNIKAKIETQKSLDSGKQFDDEGNQVTETLNKPKKKAGFEDTLSSVEYRNAFKDFCVSGKVSPILQNDLIKPIIKNADTVTTTGDASAVIPTTILQEVIQKVQSYGQIYAAVRKLSIKGGVQVPILTLKPSASWIGETTPSDRQKIEINQNIMFSYYGLECKISTSLLTETVTLQMFEDTLVSLLAEAFVKALDTAIIKGSGIGQPKGITVDDRIPAGQIVTLTPDEFADWSAWKKKVFAKMPLSYKGGASLYMASGTFEGYIDGMVDKNGQPIGRVNYGITDGPQERFGGKPVVEVEDDIISNYDDAATGDVISIYGNMNNYAINSNMQLTMVRYTDHDKNEIVDKGILIADGKILDPNGFVIIKKGAVPTP